MAFPTRRISALMVCRILLLFCIPSSFASSSSSGGPGPSQILERVDHSLFDAWPSTSTPWDTVLSNYSTPSVSTTTAADLAPIRTGPSTSLFHSRPMVALLITALVFVLIVATVLGNLMVCVAIALVRKLKAQPANLLLVSLAFADFCVGLFVMPMAAVYLLEDKWPFGSLLCRFWVTADLILCTASILNLCTISVDRYWAVSRALRYSAIRTRRRICTYIGAVWVGSLVAAVPLELLSFRGNGNVCQVSQNRIYQIVATIIAFWAPALTMVIVYVNLWNAAKKMQRQDRMVLRWQGVQCQRQQNTEPTTPKANGTIRERAENNSSPSLLANANARLMTALRPSSTAQQIQRHHSIEHDKNNNNNNNNNNVTAELDKPRPSACSALAGAIRIPLLGSYSSTASSVVGALTGGVGKSHHIQYEDKARKTLGVMMSVFICCWVPFFILALLKSQRIVHHVPTWLDSLALWLGYSNSMLNPLIYCKYNREFRIPFREMICCRFTTLQDAMRNESYYAKFGSPRSRNGRLNSTASRNGATERSDGRNRHGDDGNGKGRHSLAVGPATADKRNSSPGALAN
uniref:G-protein coupled receptors family 1 profile domain-containing protein n=1 Tax=Globodera rostochiensis TaxID=31243 RepID=A0A914IDD3_GLORO